ncbi:hypothetical protein [Schumannella soli]|uniref:DUF4398 domain-containing protein n=1 Tax=Schumannella soli TaxID=2590779 RepID=A0A506Y8T7_9MICO|nr:hypothetical protein [Schumannella soli]TPW77488.1 hypothetical protein FJ657_02055 [Schumannella soli]
MPSRRALPILAGPALAGLLCLAGCATGDPVDSSLKQAAAAQSSIVLAVDLLGEGKATLPATRTTVDDALRELASAEQSLGESPTGRRIDQIAALDDIRDATDAALAARRELDDPGTVSRHAAADLDDTASELRKAATS